jgi:hypothetical protein
MRDMVYCEKCHQWVGYKRNWDLKNNCCEKCNQNKLIER